MREIKAHEKSVVASQLNKEREYWLNKLSGAGAKSSFLYDYEKKPQESERRQEAIRFQLTGDIFSKLMKLSNQSDIRLHMIMVSALVLLLQRYNSSNDILLATPVLKQEENLEFINTVLILRSELTPGMTYKELLLQVRQTIIEATENQNYPVQTLPDQLDITFTAADDFPLAEVAILVENIHDKKYIRSIDPKVIFSFLRTTESIEGTLEYKTAFYSPSTVERIATHFKTVLEGVTANVDLAIEAIEILPGAEKKQLLIDFNSFAKEPGADRCIHHLIEEQVSRTPYLNTLVFEHEQVTYAYLNARANQLARYLRTLGVGGDSIVAIMTERSLEMITGILAILKAGGAYLPIEPASPGEKITFMLTDSAAPVLIYKGKGDDSGNLVESARNLQMVDITNTASYSQDSGNPVDVTGPSGTAYIIYTSGTTGNPKGVVVGHRQAVNTLMCRKEEYHMNPSVTSLQLFSYVFDGFVTSFFTPVISGAKTILLADDGVMDISKIKKTIIRHYVTHFISVPSLYSVIIENLTGAEASHLKVVTLAGDKVSSGIVEASRVKNPDIEIVNEYGVTEAAVMSTIYRRQENDPQIKIGHPIWNTRVYILDKRNRLQPIGIPGEVCIAGRGVARGYLNNPELTHKKFIFFMAPIPAEKKRNGNRLERLYQSGDMGRWLPHGNLQLLGRIDYQVKIRGFRIEPGEIENRLLSCPGIKETVVLAKQNEAGDKMLLAFFVPNRTLEISILREYLSKSLPGYMIPAHFVEMEQMPLTPTGKIDRKKLLQLSANIKLEAEYLPPRNSIEEQLVDIWQDLLKLEKVGVNDNFFNIGGDSIKTISLLNLINKEFKIELKTVDLYENDTIRKVAGKIVNFQEIAVDENKDEVLQEIAALKNSVLAKNKIAGTVEDVYPLSDIEKGMIFYYLKYPGTSIYLNQLVFQWKMKNFDEKIFKKALELMVQKHPILRSGYSAYDFEEPVHIVYNEFPCDFECFDISNLDRSGQAGYIGSMVEKDTEQRFIFNGENALWRMKAFIVDSENVCFFWSSHHAMVDGWSSATIMTEINNTYLKLRAGENVAPEELKNTYKEFVVEQMVGKRNPQVLDYWKQELAGYKRLQLPGQLNSSNEKEGLKSYIKFFRLEYLDKLNKAARTYNTSIKHLCFATYMYMLSMLTYERDVVVGLITNNRPICEDSEKIIGCFLNTIPVRMHVPARIKCSDYIARVEKKMVELKKYDKLSLFEIKRIIGEENQNENPIFDTIFNYIDFHVFGQLERENQQQGTNANVSPTGERQSFTTGGANLNTLLDVHIGSTGGQFSVTLTYASHKIKDEWVVKLGGYFESILNKLIEAPGEPVEKAEFISLEEKQKLLFDFNDTPKECEFEKNITVMFEEQAQKMPDYMAVVHRDIQLTYSDLDDKSNRLARLLREKGVEFNAIVGILTDRSIEMISGIMGILKAGGAYLPIEPEYPQERIDFMLKDSGAKILLTNKPEAQISKHETNPNVQNNNFEELMVLNFEHLNFEFVSNSDIRIWDFNPSNLAYIIYTSGSTGKPKGVMIEHISMMNLLFALQNTYPLTETGTYLLKTSYVFDVSITELFGWFMGGGRLAILEKGSEKDPRAILDSFERNNVTHVNFVPSMFNAFIEHVTEENKHRLSTLKYIFLAGEALLPVWVEKFNALGTNISLHNIYGPTESTVYASQYSLAGWQSPGPIPIGKPLQNLSLYILDESGCIQPIDIAGELHIGGMGLARGYLNQPELTAEKFIRFNRSDNSNRTYIIYKTGDLARWLPDPAAPEAGAYIIEFLGRIDQQVKIRGFRIELGEIEMRLTTHPGIKEAVVICREDENENKYLCAYIAGSGEIVIDANNTKFREFLLQMLPEYMIPTYFIQVEKIPLTINGKIDRKALPEPKIKTGKDYTAPGTETEKKLAEIWYRVLGVEKDVIGKESHFFEMGGNSLNLIRLIGEMNREFGLDVPFAQIIDNPHLKDMANFMEKNNLSEQPVALLNWKRAKKIFGFPDQNGFGYGYAGLGFLLNDYALYSLSFIEDEDRINRYIDIITNIQPVGPYVFFGHSAAGKLAFVIAAALEKRGYEVSDIIFVDSYFSENLVIDLTEEYMKEFRTGVEDFLKGLNAEFLMDKIFARAVKYMEYWNSIATLEKVNANVHLIVSEEVQQGEEFRIDIHCWDQLTTKVSRVSNGWGDHRSMLRGSYLAKNIKIIKEILDGIAFTK
ncbi:MAG TPA: amino acid adenylation domain-containing protein [Candidatus Kapabacteria bacterium]|nr:amino acid adenylation domain-containing protein [Candidatus Kapabacteria bacterium]